MCIPHNLLLPGAAIALQAPTAGEMGFLRSYLARSYGWCLHFMIEQRKAEENYRMETEENYRTRRHSSYRSLKDLHTPLQLNFMTYPNRLKSSFLPP